ncbi:nuclear receptor subfamily 0 group B member 2 [Esox lucius]|uniref:NR LBD domain-containing protein n=1 Tax=Esox lucius TaxID=8010 RepID=A0AAY5KUA1_ESOLU|nr:nuclear receptor subfamily 0 group B member 2 [Esox lucius]
MIFTLEEMKTTCHWAGYWKQPEQPQTILYNILNCNNDRLTNNKHLIRYENNKMMPHKCHHDQRRVVYLENPEGTRRAVSNVLVKTIHFMKSLPSFNQLPVEDQLSLLKDCWAPLFSLGMAQEQTVFQVKDVPQDGMLKRILLNNQETHDGNGSQPTLAEVYRLRTCLTRLWALDLSPKEYAYLKGAVLFNPDVLGLSTTEIVDSLQQEAYTALRDVVLTLHPGDLDRFSRILLMTSALQTISKSLITELFFRPVIGQADMFDLLSEMLCNRKEYS